MGMRARNDWFDVYAAAILEGDLEKITERVATARKAIADRIAQLEAGELATNREPRDLEDALNKLQILVNVSHTTQVTQLYGHPPGVSERPRAQLDGMAYPLLGHASTVPCPARISKTAHVQTSSLIPDGLQFLTD